VFLVFIVLNTALPHVLSSVLTRTYNPTAQQYQLITSFSLLLLGMFLSSLATLNFSLALIVGLLSSPLSFVRPARHVAWSVPLAIISPPAVLALTAAVWKHGGLTAIGDVLREAAFGWDVMGMYTPVVVWCVWWPAWLVGNLVVLGRPGERGKAKVP
jgi:glycosylphosphatidylinositol transamidase